MLLSSRAERKHASCQSSHVGSEAGGLRTLVADAIHAARVRGAELSAAND